MDKKTKVTALIPDEILKQVQEAAPAKTLTESLITALKEWIYSNEIKKLNKSIKEKPLKFKSGFTAQNARELSRRKRF